MESVRRTQYFCLLFGGRALTSRKSLRHPNLVTTPHHASQIHSTSILNNQPIGEDPVKNFEGFKYPNKVSTFEHYRLPQDLVDNEYNYPVCRDTMGIRWPGYWFKKKFVYVKEMEPEIVVPDLDGFDLKPYVSYRTEDVDTSPLTAKDLFDAVYAEGIKQKFDSGELDTYDVPQEEIDQARLKAIQTGADLFEEHTYDGVRAPMEWAKELS